MTKQEIIALVMAEIPQWLAAFQHTLDSIEGTPSPTQTKELAAHANMLSAQATVLHNVTASPDPTS